MPLLEPTQMSAQPASLRASCVQVVLPRGGLRPGVPRRVAPHPGEQWVPYDPHLYFPLTSSLEMLRRDSQEAGLLLDLSVFTNPPHMCGRGSRWPTLEPHRISAVSLA